VDPFLHASRPVSIHPLADHIHRDHPDGWFEFGKRDVRTTAGERQHSKEYWDTWSTKVDNTPPSSGLFPGGSNGQIVISA
jgi:hypothetical protein